MKTKLGGLALAILVAVTCSAQTYQKKSPAPFRDCTDCPEMVVVPPGSFTMGDAGVKGAAPPHRVAIVHPFAVSKFPITREEYQRFVAERGYSGGQKWQNPPFHQTSNDPVAFVSWNNAQAYVRWLSEKTHHPYRLLSEAEYEYAERAGTASRYWWGDDPGESPGIAVRSLVPGTTDLYSTTLYSGLTHKVIGCPHLNSNDCSHGGTVKVGSYPPNAFGLYDMGGNVDEWVEDCWHDSYQGAPTDGSAWTSPGCDSRVLRGGSYSNRTAEIGSAYRYYWFPYGDLSTFGFRVAKTL